MNKLLFAMLMGLVVSLFNVTATVQAQEINNSSLNGKERGIVAVAAFTANGDMEKLKAALNEGLDTGMTVNEIKEVLVQMYAYCGFPRSLNGIGTFMAVMDEREKKGIHDEVGPEASPLPDGKSSLELGTENQTKLIGAPATGRYISFTPAIDTFLKGHLFGDIFGRDNLDFQSRELATIAALSSMKGVNGQLQAHFNIGFNTGLSEAQMKGLIAVLADKVGKVEADNANQVLQQVLAAKKK
jgi:alkylhydroperoxidase/carboxymuconolactone decarboxylase family protein YurZ